MARIRTIKPEFWTDAALIECSLNARLLFIGTWNFADDEGNLDRSQKQIKARVFPADNIECEPLIRELLTHGLLIEYSVNSKKYLHIHGFKKHQVINRPGKPQCPIYDNSVHLHGKISEDSGLKGREGKGIENTTPAAKAADPAKEEIWKTGKTLLSPNGNTKEAGGFLGKLCKEYGQILVLQAVRDCVIATPAEPKAWLVARCQERRQKEKGNGKFNVHASTRKLLNEALAEGVARESLDSGTAPKIQHDVPDEVHIVLP